LGAPYLLDVYTMIYGVGRIRRVMAGPMWELLTLTDGGIEKLLLVELEAIRAHVHLALFLNVCFRISVVLVGGVFVMIYNVSFDGPFSEMFSGSRGLLTPVANVFFIVCSAVPTMYVLLWLLGYEPIVRMRATSALAVDAATAPHANIILSVLAKLLQLWRWELMAGAFVAVFMFGILWTGGGWIVLSLLVCILILWIALIMVSILRLSDVAQKTMQRTLARVRHTV
jgi:hypothetical protein